MYSLSCCKTVQRLQQQILTLQSDDIVRHTDLDRLQRGLKTIQQVLHRRRQLNHTDTSVFQREAPLSCTLCDASFWRLSDLRRHQTREHGIQAGRIRTFMFELHAHKGVPTCALCNAHFTTWRALKTHIEWVCQPPQELDSYELFKKQQREFRQIVERNIADLPDSALCETFKHHCALCNRFASSSIAMTHHHLSEHAEAYKKHHLYLQKLTPMVAQLALPSTPCALCKISVKKFHSCVILKQLALLFAQHHLKEDETFQPVYTGDDDLSRFKCPHCDKMMHSANALDLHLLMHEDQTGVFDAMRDINPDYSCAHCGMGHNSHTSAMRHINNGSCPEFDINKPCITLMDKDENLSKLIRAGDVDALLKDSTYLDTLDTTCVLCLKTFDRRKGLQHISQLCMPNIGRMQLTWPSP